MLTPPRESQAGSVLLPVRREWKTLIADRKIKRAFLSNFISLYYVQLVGRLLLLAYVQVRAGVTLS